MNKLMRGIGGFVLAALLTSLMVFGLTAPAQAAVRQYYWGGLIRNQVKNSDTHLMSGGVVTLESAPIFEATATVSGIATYTGLGSTTYSHASTTTAVYCLWRYPNGSGDTVHTVCTYKY